MASPAVACLWLDPGCSKPPRLWTLHSCSDDLPTPMLNDGTRGETNVGLGEGKGE